MRRTTGFPLLLLRLVLIATLVVMAALPVTGWAQEDGREVPSEPQAGQPGPGNDAPPGGTDDDALEDDDPVEEPAAPDDDDDAVDDDPVEEPAAPEDDDDAADDDDVPADQPAAEPSNGGRVGGQSAPSPTGGDAPAELPADDPASPPQPAGGNPPEPSPGVAPAVSGAVGVAGDQPGPEDVGIPGGDPQIDPASSSDDDADVDRSDTIDDPRPNQAIIRLHPSVDGHAFAARFGPTVLRVIPAENIYLVGLIPGQKDVDEVAALGADPDVVYTELNYTGQAPEARVRYFFPSAGGDTVLVDGPRLPPELILPERSCVTGSGVVVAVLDTGLDAAHPMLAAAVLANGVNMVANTFDIADSANGIDEDGDGDVDEMTGHGTHVAGIVAQVAPEAGILPVKVLDSDGIGDAFFVAAGIYYALEQGADVINLSLVSTFESRTVADAVAAATMRGVPVIAAIGNQGVEQPEEYPGSGADAVSIAATNREGNKADFSNFNVEVDLSAPGVEIASAFPGNFYVTATGTSMSTAIVSGAYALLIQQESGLDPDMLLQTFVQAANPIPEPEAAVTGKIGAGRIDIGAAIDCGEGNRLPDPTPRR